MGLFSKELLKNKLRKFGAEFFSSGKAAGSVDTSGINRFSQRSMTGKRQAKCVSYFSTATKFGKKGRNSIDETSIANVEHSEIPMNEKSPDKVVPVGPFEDFNFKLIVIESLLKQSPYFENELESIKKAYIEPFEYYVDAGPIKEVVSFFRDLQLPQYELDKITELCFDGGNEVYHLIQPDWDGEDCLFDVNSVNGFEHLRNLRNIEYISMCEKDILAPMKEKGIVID
jgi:hypothetical protein